MTVHLVRLELDRGNVERFRQVNHRILSLSYRVHAAVDALFPERKLRPFCVTKTGESYIVVLAYSQESADELGAPLELADPEVHELLVEGTLKSKPMPTLPPGKEVRFFLRAQPTGRSQQDRRRDLDVFLQAVSDQGPSVCREDVYADWARKKIQRQGAEALSAVVSSWSLSRRVRQINEHKLTHFQAPEVELEGVLRVVDSQAFLQGLTQGIGRNKGFGCGMLRLAPL